MCIKAPTPLSAIIYRQRAGKKAERDIIIYINIYLLYDDARTVFRVAAVYINISLIMERIQEDVTLSNLIQLQLNMSEIFMIYLLIILSFVHGCINIYNSTRFVCVWY